ncbi:hypothetical protein D3C87_940210 [compost metagenome]
MKLNLKKGFTAPLKEQEVLTKISEGNIEWYKENLPIYKLFLVQHHMIKHMILQEQYDMVDYVCQYVKDNNLQPDFVMPVRKVPKEE